MKAWASLALSLVAATMLAAPLPYSAWLWLNVSDFGTGGCDASTILLYSVVLPLSTAVVAGALGGIAYVAARRAERAVPGPALAGCLGSALTLLASPVVVLSYNGLSQAACSWAIPGRPLRGPQRHAPLEPGDGWGGGSTDAYWRRAACFEHASIAAFAQTALDLIELDAPEQLVERCLHAAGEEVEHAVGAMGLGTEQETFAPWSIPERRPASHAQVAWTNAVDGWWNEGRAARQAELRIPNATSATERALCERIAVEERRHASLGREIAIWAVLPLRRGTSPLRPRAEATLQALSRGDSARDVRRALIG